MVGPLFLAPPPPDDLIPEPPPAPPVMVRFNTITRRPLRVQMLGPMMLAPTADATPVTAPPPAQPTPVVPPAFYVVEVDADEDSIFERNITADLRAVVEASYGVDVAQNFFPPSAHPATLPVDNDSGDYSPGGDILPGNSFRLRALFDDQIYPIYQGHIENIKRDPELSSQGVVLSGLDGLAYLSRSGVASTALTDVTVDQCINAVLDAFQWPAGARAIGASTRTMLHWWLNPQTSGLAELTSLRNTDGPNARLYIDANGQVVFEPDEFRSTEPRCLAIQDTYTGETNVNRITRYEDGTKRLIDKIVFNQVTRGRGPIPRFSGATSISAQSVNEIEPENMPGGGNYYLAFLSHWAGSSYDIDDADITVPDGWELVHSAPQFMGADGVLYTRTYGSRSPTGGKFSWIGIAVDASLTIAGYENVLAQGHPIEVQNTETFLNTTNVSVPSVNTLGANRLAVMYYFGKQLDDQPGSISGASIRLKEAIRTGVTGGEVHAMIADDGVPNKGATGSRSISQVEGSLSDHQAMVLVFAPTHATVWQAGRDLVLAPNETLIVKATLNDPASDVQAPRETINSIPADYTVSAGSLVGSPTINQTSGIEIEITLVAGASGATIRGPEGFESDGMILRGDPFVQRFSTPVSAGTGINSASDSDYPIRSELSFDDMQELADAVIASRSTPRQVAGFVVASDVNNATLKSVLGRLISDRIRFTNAQGGIDIEGHLESVTLRIYQASRMEAELTIQEA